MRLASGVERPLDGPHEGHARERSDRGPGDAPLAPLGQEAEARAEHHPGRDGVRDSEPVRALGAHREQRQGAEPGRKRRPQRGEEDDRGLSAGHRYADLSLTTASTPPPGAGRSSASPPSASASRRTIASPSPDPGLFALPAPEPVERPLALLLREPRAVVDDVEFDPAVLPHHAHVHRVGDCNRVGDQVVDDLAEPVGRAAHAQPALSPPPDAVPVRQSLHEHRVDVDRLRPHRSRVRAGKCEQGLDQPAEPLDLGERRPRVLRIHVLEPEPERRQRRPQLVRGVCDERLLRVEQLLELGRSLVELTRQPAHFFRALLRRADVEVPGTHLGGRMLELPQRPRHAAGDPEPEQRDARQHDPGDRERASASSGARGCRRRSSGT